TGDRNGRKLAGNIQKYWNPHQKQGEGESAQRREIHAEQTKRSRVEKSETAGIDFIEVFVRNLSVQDPFGRLRQSSFVVGIPTSFQDGSHVSDAQNEGNEDKDRISTLRPEVWRCRLGGRAGGPTCRWNLNGRSVGSSHALWRSSLGGRVSM